MPKIESKGRDGMLSLFLYNVLNIKKKKTFWSVTNVMDDSLQSYDVLAWMANLNKKRINLWPDRTP